MFLTRWGFSGSRNKMDGMHPNRPLGFNSPFVFADSKDPKKGVFDLNRYFNGKVKLKTDLFHKKAGFFWTT